MEQSQQQNASFNNNNVHLENHDQSRQHESSSQKRNSSQKREQGEHKQQVIDLENEDITYNQAKRIRQQVEKDVELLRNRVRMLQLEEEKAMKKINETKKKTKQIQELKQTNDEKYQKQIRDQQNNKGNIIMGQSSTQQQRDKQKQEIQSKQFKMYEQKKKEVLKVKMLKQNQQVQKEQMTQEQIMQAQEKKNFIKAQKEIANFKKEQFLQKKIMLARKEVNTKMNVERNQIKNYEQEAQQLEMLEADLLRKLQETQLVEKDAFTQLETAMIDASLPKKMRVQANSSQYSDNSRANEV